MVKQVVAPTYTLAREIVAGYRGKNLTAKAAIALEKEIEALLSARVAAMLTYGPDEIRRISEFQGVPEDTVRGILSHAGGNCTDAAGVEAAWARGVTEGVERDFLGEARARMEVELVSLLHASRDGMRNIGLVDTKQVAFDMGRDGGYYAECVGILRALALLGYGFMYGGRADDPMSLTTWFKAIQERVLLEEGFRDGTHRCKTCLANYGKDDLGRESADDGGPSRGDEP